MKGSWYDMGYQHGTLLKEEALAARDAMVATIKRSTWVPFWLAKRYVEWAVADRQRPYIPQAFSEEMRGVADATGVSFDEIRLLHAYSYLSSCSVLAAWGRATASGKLLFVRSNDTFFVVDEEKGQSIHGLIFVYEPTDGVPFTTVSWPGYVGASDGMNVQGIAVANMTNRSRYETSAGLPMIFRIKQALWKATSLDEARELIMARPFEGGYNFIVADAKIPSALVIEMDAATSYVGGWDGPAESNAYVYRGSRYTYEPTPDLLLRTNHPLSTALIAHHSDPIDPGDDLDCRSGPRYRSLKTRFTQLYGQLTDTLAMEVLRGAYRDMYQGPGDGCFPTTTHQTIFTPHSGQFLVALSRGQAGGKEGAYTASAYHQRWHSFNLFDLLRTAPPAH